MARFEVGEWVRINIPNGGPDSSRHGKIGQVQDMAKYIQAHEPGGMTWVMLPGESGPRSYHEHELTPAPPPVGERPGEYHAGMTLIQKCPCKSPDFDPSLWCACTPEPGPRPPLHNGYACTYCSAWIETRDGKEIEPHNCPSAPREPAPEPVPLGTVCPDCGGHFAGVSDPKTVHDCSTFKPTPAASGEAHRCEHCGETGIHACPHYSYQRWLRDTYGNAVCDKCRHHISLHIGETCFSMGCHACNPEALSMDQALARTVEDPVSKLDKFDAIETVNCYDCRRLQGSRPCLRHRSRR